MRKIAISACLLGEPCRHDASDNKNLALLEQLQEDTLISFCPEDYAFGSPRPTMDLQINRSSHTGSKAICNVSGKDLSTPIKTYAKMFFDTDTDIDLVIGKDRSPSCGVCSAKLYDEEKNLLSSKEVDL